MGATVEIKSKRFKGVYHKVLKDGTKSFYILYKDPIEKKTKRLKIGTDKEGINEQYAYNLKNEIITKTRLGEDPNIPILKAKLQKTTIDDLAKNYLEYLFNTRGKTRTNLQAQSRYFKRISPFIGHLQLTQLTKQHAKKIQKSLIDEGLSPTTTNHIITLISTIINYNLKNDIIKGSNPLFGMQLLKNDNKRTRYLNKEEIKTLLEHTKDDKILHLFTLLALTTGARLNGILAIQKKDIDLVNGTIKINDFKSGGTYRGFISDKVKPLLIERMEELKPNDYIISYDNGKKTDDKRIQRRLQPILNKLFNKNIDDDNRLEKVVIHTLRHTFASLLAINGTPIFTIQKLMNHKDIQMTLRYAKLAPDSGQRDVNNLF